MKLWKTWSNVFSKTISVSCYLGYFACVVHCTLEHLGDFVMCQGPSMEPTIRSNDIVLTEHLSISMKKFKKGDIIVCKSPSNPKQYICKRVVAMPGDKIRFNGFFTKIVPEGHVWLEGDNKVNSTDSREYGPVPFGLLRSRAICRIFPIHSACLF